MRAADLELTPSVDPQPHRPAVIELNSIVTRFRVDLFHGFGNGTGHREGQTAEKIHDFHPELFVLYKYTFVFFIYKLKKACTL